MVIWNSLCNCTNTKLSLTQNYPDVFGYVILLICIEDTVLCVLFKSDCNHRITEWLRMEGTLKITQPQLPAMAVGHPQLCLDTLSNISA